MTSSERDYVAGELAAGIETRRRLLEEGCDAILRAGALLASRLGGGGKVLWCGNGGSAADCQHISTELVARFSGRERPGIHSVALTTDTSLLTALANDYDFERVFARQVEALGRPGDVLVGISTSGSSRNVIQAVESARRGGIDVVALVGGKPSRLAELATVTIAIPSTDTQRIQELHITVGHILCGLIEDALYPAP
jgi:D-sedoheptulose 7-phosphate isomerase